MKESREDSHMANIEHGTFLSRPFVTIANAKIRVLDRHFIAAKGDKLGTVLCVKVVQERTGWVAVGGEVLHCSPSAPESPSPYRWVQLRWSSIEGFAQACLRSLRDQRRDTFTARSRRSDTFCGPEKTSRSRHAGDA